MKKVFIVQSSWDYEQMFKRLGYEVIHQLQDADLICFTGGEDVSPDLYGEEKHPQTFNNPQRDAQESLLFNYAVDMKIPMVGICRGGQFLNVMSGGSMYQHVENHCRDHCMSTRTHGKILVSSTHHQMMRPHQRESVLLAEAFEGGEKEFMDNGQIKKGRPLGDAEVVYYTNTKSLCFQPHPEFYNPSDKRTKKYKDMYEYFESLLKEFCS